MGEATKEGTVYYCQRMKSWTTGIGLSWYVLTKAGLEHVGESHNFCFIFEKTYTFSILFHCRDFGVCSHVNQSEIGGTELGWLVVATLPSVGRIFR